MEYVFYAGRAYKCIRASILQKQLLREMEEWIEEMHKELEKGDRSIAETGCGITNGGKKKLGKGDKEWCEFILGYLWKIKEKTRDQPGDSIVNVKMKAYVRCAVMKVWFLVYRDMYCKAQEVIERAFAAMEELCQLFSHGTGCNECKYGTIPVVFVGSVNIYNLILKKVKEKSAMLNKMYSWVPKNVCNKDKGKNTAPVVAHPHPQLQSATSAAHGMTLTTPDANTEFTGMFGRWLQGKKSQGKVKYISSIILNENIIFQQKIRIKYGRI
ncbi:SICA antigen [Plasmodium coatneyi]|uniref:SICA antigen n=1 Tax=Plasmodium coatneyi TaxID=208452 RepID=A0A1B1E7M0_9APIC|nr:SICA antigen [Plasmodium coatneyi]ANQ10998.1 SICA antigen [Plasmodium coatneyi]